MLSLSPFLALLCAGSVFALGMLVERRWNDSLQAPQRRKPVADDSNVQPVPDDQAAPLRALFREPEQPAAKRRPGRPRKMTDTPKGAARRSDTAITRPMAARPSSKLH